MAVSATESCAFRAAFTLADLHAYPTAFQQLLPFSYSFG